MTKLRVKSGQDVYTKLSPQEVRQYLSGGVKTGAIDGFLEDTEVTPIYISVHAIVYIHL